MGRSVNKVILVGNAGRDPDVQTTAGGSKVAHVSLATTRRIPRNGGYEDRTEWHRLTLWNRMAEIAEQVIVINDTHYGRVEDAQMGICHMICYAFMENPQLAS